MNIRSLFALRTQPSFARSIFSVILLAAVTLGASSCGQNLYRFPQYNFAGRPIPPSQLAERVMVAVTSNGNSGGLQILDGLRDIRNNLQNTVPGFAVAGFTGGYPQQIISFPEQLRGYVYSSSSPFVISNVSYGTETSVGSAATLNSPSASIAIAPDFVRIISAQEQAGTIAVIDNVESIGYSLNLPNVYRVAVNNGDTVALAMVRNSDSLYRIIKLNKGTTVFPPGAVDCEPTLLPIYCVVPVPGKFDRPTGVTFSLDGSTAYILNCGQECGGGSNGGAGVSLIPQGSVQLNLIPTSLPYPAVVSNTVSIPGGVTAGILDSNNLYLAGQQLQPDGLYAGRLTTLPLLSLTPSASVSISDGNHSKLLFADDNTLWIGSQYCATGERAKLNLNTNCLTRYDLGAHTASIVPNVTPGGSTTVPYPNQDGNQFYYGSLTGLCWIQNYHKIYTAYGGQVHAFNTADGSEINNQFITVQGTALDVAYMDALSNSAN